MAGALWFSLDMALEARRRLNDAALSPDGAYMATVTGQGLGVRGAVRVWDVGSGREAAFMAIEGPVWVCAWSPDGKKLAVGDHVGNIRVYDSGTWRESATLTGSRDMIKLIAWSPDGAAIATGDSRGSIWVWEIAGGGGSPRFSTPVHERRIDAVAWAPNGGQLATGSADASVAVIDARDGKVIRRLQGHASDVATVAFSPDGTLLASGSLGAPYVIVWNVQGGERKDFEGHQNSVERVVWSGDGRYLASVTQDNRIAMWDVRRLALARRFQLGGGHSGKGLAWSPRDTTLAAGDAAGVSILDPARDVAVRTLRERGEDYDSVEIAGWSSDGKRLGTFGRSDRTSNVWDVERAVRLKTFSLGLWRSLTE
jgi:WD40 repeat protein